MGGYKTYIRIFAVASILLLLAHANVAFAQQGPPAFPQRFELRGPEVASFGFAVTQPGPIVIEVRAQSPQPLRVTLTGPSRIENAGAGRVGLRYDVLPQDIQRGILWSVSITRQTPGPEPLAAEVDVRSPPGDARAARQAAALRPTQQQMDQAVAAMNANVEQYVAARHMQFNQQLKMRDQNEQQKLQAILAMRGAANPGIAPPAGADNVRTRAVGGGLRDALGTGEIVREAEQLRQNRNLVKQPAPTQPSAPVQAAPPQIATLEQTSGGPLSAVAINGVNFGSGGRVMLSVPPGTVIPCATCAPVSSSNLPDQALAATIASWSDNRIVITLPNLTGVFQYSAQIFVVRADNAYSNRAGFGFVPRQEVRYLRGVPGDRRYTTSVVTQPLPATNGTSQMVHVRIPVFPASEFVGEKGNDELFLYTDLQNGWTVSNVKLFPIGEQPGVPPEVNSILRDAGGAYIAGTPSGADLYLNVRWWINALRPFMQYTWSIEIIGPAGIPDGAVVK
jgi:hypothetical protein